MRLIRISIPMARLLAQLAQLVGDHRATAGRIVACQFSAAPGDGLRVNWNAAPAVAKVICRRVVCGKADCGKAVVAKPAGGKAGGRAYFDHARAISSLSSIHS